MKFNVAETNAPASLMLSIILVHQVELQLAWFKGKTPTLALSTTRASRSSTLALTTMSLKDVVESQEFGWGQGFERDERMFQVRTCCT